MNNQLARVQDRHVAIIGAGFSGTLLAISLLRHEGPRATLIERRPRAGRGIAYSTAHPEHLLNVRAANMSALPDDADHFARWLAAHHPGLGVFVPRIVYGDYLADLLRDAMARTAGSPCLRGKRSASNGPIRAGPSASTTIARCAPIP